MSEATVLAAVLRESRRSALSAYQPGARQQAEGLAIRSHPFGTRPEGLRRSRRLTFIIDIKGDGTESAMDSEGATHQGG
jgi:hypothetical protein